MKHLTAIILTLAMLCAVSCNGNTTTPAETTTTTVGSDAPIAPSETTVTTAPTEVILDEAHANLPVYTTDRDVSVFYEIGQEYQSIGTAPEKYVVRFEDAPAIALVLTTHTNTPTGKLGNDLVAIYVGSYKHECSINLFDGDGLAVDYTKDAVCVVRPGASVPGEAVIVCENGAWESSGSDEYFITAESDGETMTYCRDNRKIFAEMNQVQQWAAYVDADTVYRISGNVQVGDDGIVMEEASRMTIAEYYLTDEMAARREKSGCATFAELKEKHETAAFLSTIPVYEYSYEDNRYFNCFDKIGAAEYAKYAAGEEFDEYFAIKFTEYPDIAIIGQVVTEPGLDSVYDQRVMDSVIRNGERHYLTENKNGPGFYAYVTEDFVCITMAASGIGGAFYAYDGGAEYHCRNSLSTNGQQTEPWDNNGDFSLQDLFESKGIMNYYLFGKNYEGAYQTGFRSIHNRYKGPDDMFLEQGTVQLIDGKITYVASETLTVAEWYKKQTGFHEESGCYTIEEFIEWLKTGAQWK